MQLTEFYNRVEGNYDEVKSRLLTDERIKKYLKKFPACDDFANLQKTLGENDWESAFRFSHNLKGMCLNLGLKSLFEPSSALCENLRGGSPKEDCGPMMDAVEQKFTETLDLISELFAE